jgi:hypothetical protein
MLVRQWLVYFSGRDNDGVDLADLLKAQKLGAVCRAIASPPNYRNQSKMFLFE